ncbi:MAG: cadherin-like domain-containing protein [Phycisphaerales bacterium]|nr:cadherin-like domain-containing protein [Phycisphaerales bacterium]
MRQFIEKYGYPLIAVIVVLVILVLWLNHRNSAPPRPNFSGDSSLAFFVNETTGKESVRSVNDIPPLPADDDTDSLVIAVKFKADTEKDAKIWYYVKYPVKVRDWTQSLPADDLNRMNALEESRLIRAVEPGSQWLPATDPEAVKIMTIPDASPGHPRRPVFPEKPNE